jgi:hypothetical protein
MITHESRIVPANLPPSANHWLRRVNVRDRTDLPLAFLQLESRYWLGGSLRPMQLRQELPYWPLAADKIRSRLCIAQGSLSYRSGSMVVVTAASGSERGLRVEGHTEHLRNSGTVVGCYCQGR